MLVLLGAHGNHAENELWYAGVDENCGNVVGMRASMGAREMRQRRKQREWIEDVALFAIAAVAFTITFPAVVYVHENAPAWEAPLIFVSLGLGVLPALWFWRTRRYGWVASIVSALLLAFSFVAALFHGWELQAMALIALASVVCAVIVFVGLARVTRRYASAMRAVGDGLNGDPLFRHDVLFRDDGERITVYPRRRRLILGCMAQAAIIAGIGCFFVLVRPDDLSVRFVLGLLACLLLPIFLATLSRLVIRRPSLVIGPNGILDSSSFLWSGVGLIRWDEILAVFPTTRSSGWVKQHFLDIMVTDLSAIRKGLPLLRRFSLLSNTYSRLSQVLIGQSLLETPVDELAEQISHYVETHAPAGWRAVVAEDSAPAPTPLSKDNEKNESTSKSDGTDA